MQPIEILYIISSFVALSACVPQLQQLVRTRLADDFSLQTWAMWTGTHTVTLMYMLSIRNMLLILVTIAWVIFYASMTYLIVKYRRTPAVVLVPEEQQS